MLNRSSAGPEVGHPSPLLTVSGKAQFNPLKGDKSLEERKTKLQKYKQA